jgi:hypothetical protein
VTPTSEMLSGGMRAHQPGLAVLRAGHAPADMVPLQAGEGEAVLAAVGRDEAHYVDVDRAIVRAKLEPPVTLHRTHLAADGENASLLTGIPNDAALRIDGRAIEHDRTLELIGTLPRHHHVEVTAARYRTWRAILRAA